MMNTTRVKFQVLFLALIAVSAFILFIQSFSEERRLDDLQDSISELYNDRLVAEHAVFRMNDLVHQKQNLGRSTQKAIRQGELSNEIVDIYNAYARTKLTPAEEVVSREVERQIYLMLSHESEGALNGPVYNRLLLLLDRLSNIQVEEGSRLRSAGQQTLASSMAGVKLHTAVNIVLLLSLLLLFRNTALGARLLQQHELN